MGQKKFKTEVADLLHLIIHSLYSNREIFMRELVSNASDAIDKLKFLMLTELKGIKAADEQRIEIDFDADGKWLSIVDTGVGMDEADMEQFLGTIANSGTRSFVEKMGKEQEAGTELIGKFGVGFYSAFMVANEVVVISRKAGADGAWAWHSQGVGSYEIKPAERSEIGTEIRLTLNDAGKEFANEYRIRQIVERYSDHISHPIYLSYEKRDFDEQGKEKSKRRVTERINSGSAIWKRAKSEIDEKGYDEFYKSLSHDQQQPLFHLHLQAEGAMEYAALLYVPREAPPNLYYSDFEANIRLYIQRVFITDDAKMLLPNYLRFVRGVIDCEDLPLNVSREILQDNALLQKIQNAIVKKLLNKCGELAAKQPQLYQNFTTHYNRLLKEGLYQDFTNRDQLMELVRFRSTHDDGWVSLSEYKSRAETSSETQKTQKNIYYLIGSEVAHLRNSPLLERYQSRGIEVLLLSDEIDELLIPTLPPYKELAFRAINKSAGGDDAADEIEGERDKKLEQQLSPLKQRIADALKERVAKVEFSARLLSSPACVVFSENTPSQRMKEMLRSMGMDGNEQKEKPTLEINPTNSIVQSLEGVKDEELFSDLCHLLLEQSLLIENIPFENSHDFVTRINRIIGRAVKP